jgi:hypothetical protein
LSKYNLVHGQDNQPNNQNQKAVLLPVVLMIPVLLLMLMQHSIRCIHMQNGTKNIP